MPKQVKQKQDAFRPSLTGAGALKLKDACRYLGGIAPITLRRQIDAGYIKAMSNAAPPSDSDKRVGSVSTRRPAMSRHLLPVRGEVDLVKLGFPAIILRRGHRHRKRFYLSFSRW
jgi:hypothetical protein